MRFNGLCMFFDKNKKSFEESHPELYRIESLSFSLFILSPDWCRKLSSLVCLTPSSMFLSSTGSWWRTLPIPLHLSQTSWLHLAWRTPIYTSWLLRTGSSRKVIPAGWSLGVLSRGTRVYAGSGRWAPLLRERKRLLSRRLWFTLLMMTTHTACSFLKRWGAFNG